MTHTLYDQRLEHLLRTAARVFAARGYHSTTMRDLSRATGMSLAGIYYYVSGKDELLYLIQERCFRRVVEGARAAVEHAADAVEELERFIEHHVTFFAEHMDEMKVLSHEADSLSGGRKEAIARLKRRYVDLLARILSDLAGDPGGWRADPRIAAYALFGMMNWIYTWYDPEGPVAPEALAAQFSELFLRGAAPSATSITHGGR